MTVAEWQTIEKWLSLDDISFLIDLTFNNMQFCDTDKEKAEFENTLERLQRIRSNVIPY